MSQLSAEARRAGWTVRPMQRRLEPKYYPLGGGGSLYAVLSDYDETAVCNVRHYTVQQTPGTRELSYIPRPEGVCLREAEMRNLCDLAPQITQMMLLCGGGRAEPVQRQRLTPAASPQAEAQKSGGGRYNRRQYSVGSAAKQDDLPAAYVEAHLAQSHVVLVRDSRHRKEVRLAAAEWADLARQLEQLCQLMPYYAKNCVSDENRRGNTPADSLSTPTYEQQACEYWSEEDLDAHIVSAMLKMMDEYHDYMPNCADNRMATALQSLTAADLFQTATEGRADRQCFEYSECLRQCGRLLATATDRRSGSVGEALLAWYRRESGARAYAAGIAPAQPPPPGTTALYDENDPDDCTLYAPDADASQLVGSSSSTDTVDAAAHFHAPALHRQHTRSTVLASGSQHPNDYTDCL